MDLKFLDLFSGIGGFRLGMELAGHECVGHCEIDRFANKSYIAMHEPKEEEWYAEDIKKITRDEIPRADVWCFGFPCQDISVAGKQTGINGARSGLFYKVIELIESKEEKDKPSLLFIENVKNLLSVNEGWDFAEILISLDEAGYDVEWQIVNTSWYLPQNRERVFIIGHLRGKSTRKVFPIGGDNKQALKQVINGSDAQRVYDVNGLARTLKSEGGGQGAKTGLYLINKVDGEIKFRNIANCIDANYYKGLDSHQQRTGVLDIRACLSPDRAEKRQNGRRVKEPGEPMFTLTAQDRHGVVIREATQKGYAVAYEGDSINLTALGSKTRRGRVGRGIANTLDTSCNQAVISKTYVGYEENQDWDKHRIQQRIRRLTPRECFRLQGFPDEYFNKASAVNSDTQLYKQAGNSVSVPVINEIAQRLEIWIN